MEKIKLPHLPPIRFAREILQTDGKDADVLIEFEQIPTLPMLVEAAAQSCAAFRKSDDESAFLVSFKGVKLLKKPVKQKLVAHVTEEHRLDFMRYVDFVIRDENDSIAAGKLVLAVE